MNGTQASTCPPNYSAYRSTLSVSEGARETSRPYPPIDEGPSGYSTIDLPTEARTTMLVRVVVESSTSGLELASFFLRPGQEVVLGAAPDADIVLADPTVSARHCAICHKAGLVEVLDLGSRNGIRWAGARADRASCSVGGTFEIGRCVVRIEAGASPSAVHAEQSLPGVIGASAPMRRLAAAVRGIGPMRLPVLLRGESGTGKEVIAQAIHKESPRARRSFVVLNAATIRPELAESELFGHQRGAFTGATRERRGAFREAHQGTLFLDEIASLPLDVQAKLLRVVEQGSVRPLGGETEHRIDVRLVAATCEPLEQMVRERTFRADLYERLAGCILRLPPLRERLDDITVLSRHLLRSSEVGRRDLSSCALAALRRHSWPGNVRELRNVLIQAAIIARGTIRGEHIVEVLASREERTRRKVSPEDALRIFEESGYNVSAAARRAELPRSTMRDLLSAAGAPLGMKRSAQNSPTMPTPP